MQYYTTYKYLQSIMTASANEIMGSLIFRTSEALNKNEQFMDAIKEYLYWPSIVNDGKFHLWHFPGTQQEISQVFTSLGKDSINGSKLKYPAVLSFQGIYEEHEHSPGITLKRYNLAIVAPVLSGWTTQEREAQVYKLVLRPIEEELIRQIESCEYFHNPIGHFPYVSAYIPTTGHALNSVMKVQYGDFLDAIEFPNFTLKALNGICTAKSNKIIEESILVTDEIKNIKR